MPIPIWAGHYIGLPFKDHGRDTSGVDCWGLVRLIFTEQFSIALPSLHTGYRHTRDIFRIQNTIECETKSWNAIPVAQAECGDVIVMRLRGVPLHVGIVLDHQHMLHIEQGINSAIERYTSSTWQDRLYGVYRYQQYFE